jgi:DNA polymerase V
MARGGKRSGSGRPQGSGKFGEPTKAVRIPESQVEAVMEWVENGCYRLPFFESAVAAGLPSMAEDEVHDLLDLNELLIRRPQTTFCVRVAGSSMINAGIHHRDILVVDSSSEWRVDGKTVSEGGRKGDLDA